MQLVLQNTLSGLLHSCSLGRQLAGHQRMSKQFPDIFFLIPRLPSHLLSFLLSDCSDVLFDEVLIIARVPTYFSSKCSSHTALPQRQAAAAGQAAGYSRIRRGALASFL